MTNNLEQIKGLLRFESNDDFYHLQVLKRKKENPELGSNSVVIKTYYITSIEHLERVMPEIITLCDLHNARGCINLNVRSFERAAFHTLKKISDIIMNRDYKSVRSAFDSVCGEYGTGRDKRWIVDVDDKHPKVIASIVNHIQSLDPVEEDKIITLLETKNGFHIITKPFNVSKFQYTEVDIHKNNPTILYIS